MRQALISVLSHVQSKAKVMFNVFYNIAMKFNALSPELVLEVQHLVQGGEPDKAFDALSRGLKEVGIIRAV